MQNWLYYIYLLISFLKTVFVGNFEKSIKTENEEISDYNDFNDDLYGELIVNLYTAPGNKYK